MGILSRVFFVKMLHIMLRLIWHSFDICNQTIMPRVLSSDIVKVSVTTEMQPEVLFWGGNTQRNINILLPFGELFCFEKHWLPALTFFYCVYLVHFVNVACSS